VMTFQFAFCMFSMPGNQNEPLKIHPFSPHIVQYQLVDMLVDSCFPLISVSRS